MRDVRIITPIDRTKAKWVMDIDIVNGFPVYVPDERNTQDQRAALATYMTKGTIPGMPDIGVDWSALYQQNSTILNIDNEIRQNIQRFATTINPSSQSYMPVYTSDKNGIQVGIYQA